MKTIKTIAQSMSFVALLHSSLFAVHPRFAELMERFSQFELEFVQNGVSIGKVTYSGPGAVVLSERLKIRNILRGQEVVDYVAVNDLLDGLAMISRLGPRVKFDMPRNCFRRTKIIEVTDLNGSELPLGNLTLTNTSDIIQAATLSSKDVEVFVASFFLSVISFFAEFMLIYAAVEENDELYNKLDYIFYWSIDFSNVNFYRLSLPIMTVLAHAYAISRPINYLYRRCLGKTLNPSWRFLLMHWIYGRDVFVNGNIQIRVTS